MRRLVAVFAMGVALVVAHPVREEVHAQSAQRYQVTITNMTRAQSFTPILAATHTDAIRLFIPGTAATPQLREIAEEGNITPMMTLLRGVPSDVQDVVSTAGLLTPGVTLRLDIMAGGAGGAAGPFDRISVVSMLIPTNDAFFGVSGVPLPTGNDVITIDALAYDAGTERNDERCASIPGPSFAECGGPGGGARVGGGEGAITIHNGIHGTGDLRASERDWRNPVARITIRRGV